MEISSNHLLDPIELQHRKLHSQRAVAKPKAQNPKPKAQSLKPKA